MTGQPRADQPLRLYRTGLHPCPYLPDRRSSNLFVDPAMPMSPQLYQQLLALGFRRSGEHVYRPACPTCRLCIPARIPVLDFRPRRSQRRAWRNADRRLRWIERPGVFDPEHYALYRRYQSARHAGGAMENGDAQDYLEFLTASWSETRFFELREAERLVAVAVADLTGAALSSVYTFFDPRTEALSPGVLCILWQIHEALARGKQWVYLGFWVPGCRKMAYKSDYRPLEILSQQHWRRLGAHPPTEITGLTDRGIEP